jgi:hypothetical protein
MHSRPRSHVNLHAKNKFLGIVALVACLATSLLAQDEVDAKFEAALRKQILSNHQRHIPTIIIKGNEVTLIYESEFWEKNPEFDKEAKFDALNCLKADYAALKRDRNHRLRDYFHVVEYCASTGQVIGEATVKRAGYPSEEAVDEAIAQSQ